MSTTTTANFDALIKKYMPYTLFREEMEKRMYFMQKVNIKDGWKGGQMDIPFKAAKATDYKYGKLIQSSKIGKARYGIGSIQGYKELWGAMVFEDHDLMKHDSMEQSFISILPEQLDDFIFGMKEAVSRSLLNGGHIAKVTGVAEANVGILNVTRPEFFDLDQFIQVKDTAGVLQYEGYVTKIFMQDMKIEVSNARLDNTPAVIDMSANAAVGQLLTIEGDMSAAAFVSLDDQLLPAGVNGASANIFGVEKTSTPYTQSYAVNGSGLANNAAGLLNLIFKTQNRVRQIANGSNPTDAVMGYGLLATIMEALETGAVGNQRARWSVTDKKVSIYGWTEIEVMGIGGSLKLVGVNEMSDDSIKILDWRGIDLHTNGLFEIHKDLNGNQYYVERSEDGYRYVTDIRLFGELVVTRPSYQAIIHSID